MLAVKPGFTNIAFLPLTGFGFTTGWTADFLKASSSLPGYSFAYEVRKTAAASECSASSPSNSCCRAGDKDSYAWCMSANIVSPPTGGSSKACSNEPRGGFACQEPSECQYVPASSLPWAPPSLRLLDTRKICG